MKDLSSNPSPSTHVSVFEELQTQKQLLDKKKEDIEELSDISTGISKKISDIHSLMRTIEKLYTPDIIKIDDGIKKDVEEINIDLEKIVNAQSENFFENHMNTLWDEEVEKYPNTKLSAFVDTINTITNEIKELPDDHVEEYYEKHREAMKGISVGLLGVGGMFKELIDEYHISFGDIETIFAKINATLSDILYIMNKRRKNQGVKGGIKNISLFESIQYSALYKGEPLSLKMRHSFLISSPNSHRISIQGEYFDRLNEQGLLETNNYRIIGNLLKENYDEIHYNGYEGLYIDRTKYPEKNIFIMDDLEQKLLDVQLEKIRERMLGVQHKIDNIVDIKKKELEEVKQDYDLINKQISDQKESIKDIEQKILPLQVLENHGIDDISVEQFEEYEEKYKTLARKSVEGAIGSGWNRNGQEMRLWLDNGNRMSQYIDPILGLKASVYDKTWGGGNGLRYSVLFELVRPEDGKIITGDTRNTRDYSEDNYRTIENITEIEPGSGKYQLMTNRGHTININMGPVKLYHSHGLKSEYIARENMAGEEKIATFTYDKNIADNAEVILVYRDNDIYKKLEKDIQTIYKTDQRNNKEKSIYIIKIPANTEKIANIDALKDFLKTYPQTRIDNTTGRWTESNNKRILDIENDGDVAIKHAEFKDMLASVSRFVGGRTINIVVKTIVDGKSKSNWNRLVEHTSYLDLGDGPKQYDGYGKTTGYFNEIYQQYEKLFKEYGANIRPVTGVSTGGQSKLIELGEDLVTPKHEVSDGIAFVDGHDEGLYSGSKITHVGGFVDLRHHDGIIDNFKKLGFERNKRLWEQISS